MVGQQPGARVEGRHCELRVFSAAGRPCAEELQVVDDLGPKRGALSMHLLESNSLVDS